MTDETNTHHWFNTQSGDGGQSILWLHGWGQDHSAFDRLRSLFDDDYKNTAYDQSGFGKSALPPVGAGTEDYADMLSAQIPEGGPHILISHSFGGRVSIQLASKYPDLVKAVILIAGAGIPRSRSLAFKLRATALKTLGKLARISDKLFKSDFYNKYAQRYGSADYRNAGALRPTFVNVVNENLTNAARQVSAPVLLLYGSDDTEAPSEIGRKYEAAIPIARFEELSGFDHYDILTRGAYQCEALIRGFLKDIESE